MKRINLQFVIAYIAGLLSLQISSKAAIIYVNQSAAGINNGTSWANAFTSLSPALAIAMSGDQIWVAAGVYKPSVPFDFNNDGILEPREVTFSIPNGVALYGGFSGTEANLGERTWLVNLTILSGDMDNNDQNGDGNFIAETTTNIIGNNAYHILLTINASNTTRIDGFTVTAGSASTASLITSDPNLDGGGLYNSLISPSFASSPGIYNVHFSGNFAKSEGGAIFNFSAPAGGEITSVISNCTFTGNKSDLTAGAIYTGSFQPGNYQLHILNSSFINNEAFRRGGAIYLVGDHALIENSIFQNNKATAISPDFSTLPASGGAVNLVASNASFNNCIFMDNHATGNPTGPYEGGGGGAVYISTNEPQTISLGNSEPEFISCGFYSNLASNNTGAWGGAVVHLSDAGVLRPVYTNCVFYGNQAQNHGGAVANFIRVMSSPEGYIPALSPRYTNCTFTSNHAQQRGGAIYNDGQLTPDGEVLQAAIENCILWVNTAVTDGPEIFNDGNQTIRNSLVAGSGGSGGGWDISLGNDLGSNIDANPLFVNAALPLGADNIAANADDGLKLQVSSPAINSGRNAASGLVGITTDYTGQSRIRNTTVDMGAYEYAGIIIPDFDFLWIYNWRDLIEPCLQCPPPWALVLISRVFPVPEFEWKERAQFYIKGENAYLTGELINRKMPNSSFVVHMKFTGQMDWKAWSSSGGSWFAYTAESYRIAKTEHVNWNFWTLSNESYIECKGDIQGKIELKPLKSFIKSGFQIGKGANALDSDLGMAGNFCFEGTVKVSGKKTKLSGVGSMNVDAVPCGRDCQSDESFADVRTEFKSATDFDLSDASGFELFPVPANNQLTIRVAADGDYQLVISDLSGKILFRESWNQTEGMEYQISLENFTSGIYMLQLTSSRGEVYLQKLIVDKK